MGLLQDTITQLGERIILEIAVKHNVPTGALKSRHVYQRKMMGIRKEAYLALCEAGFSYSQVGKLFDDRDHTTIYHAINDRRRERDIENIRAHKYGKPRVQPSAAGQSPEGGGERKQRTPPQADPKMSMSDVRSR